MTEYFNDPEEQKISEASNFPGSLELMVTDKNGEIREKGPFLHPEYRRYTGDSIINDEFIFFVTKLLATICPNQHKFKKNNHIKLISEIFTPSDEAYVLVLLWAQKRHWEKQKTDIDRGQKLTKKKEENCLNQTGIGWCKEEQLLYGAVLNEIKIRREEETSIQLEIHLRDEYWRKMKIGSRLVTKPLKSHGGFLRNVTDINGVSYDEFFNDV